MSSPMHSLKKNKIPLFGHVSGKRPIPFRHPEYTEDESKLLEEVTNTMVQEKIRSRSFTGQLPLKMSNESQSSGGDYEPLTDRQAACAQSPAPRTPAPPTAPPSDQELMRLMMNRVAQLEQQVVTQGQDIQNKDRRIKVLEDKLRIADKARRESEGGGRGRAFGELETHCLLLQQQVHEMETFLAEYGMVWVGDESNDNSDTYISEGIDDDPNIATKAKETRVSASDNGSTFASDPLGLWRQDTSMTQEDSTFSIDFNLLIENIKDLNVLADAGVAQMKKTPQGAKFEIPESVQLTIYANGILMFEGPFRPYTDPSTKQCVQDLLDGYFPSELQARYPDGVPFLVTDLRSTFFQPKYTPLAFGGEGNALGGEIKPSRLIPSKYMDPTQRFSQATQGFSVSSQHPGQALSPAQFLNKLPKSIVKDGKVIDVRDSVGKTLTGNDTSSKPRVSVISTKVTQEMSKSVDASDIGHTTNERPKSYRGHGDVTTLRVVTENGDHTYIVKMKFKETLGNLRTYLDTQNRPTHPYDIVSTFPHKVHKNNNMNLEESGLTPNAVLHLKPCKD